MGDAELEDRHEGVTGLANLGNTCYINSAVQALAHCPPFSFYFLDVPNLV